jgi:hypothetical protein
MSIVVSPILLSIASWAVCYLTALMSTVLVLSCRSSRAVQVLSRTTTTNLEFLADQAAHLPWTSQIVRACVSFGRASATLHGQDGCGLCKVQETERHPETHLREDWCERRLCLYTHVAMIRMLLTAGCLFRPASRVSFCPRCLRMVGLSGFLDRVPPCFTAGFELYFSFCCPPSCPRRL